MGSAEFSDRMWSHCYSLSPPTLTPSCFRLHESPHLEKIGRAFWHLDNCLRQHTTRFITASRSNPGELAQFVELLL
ncbi:hypothetical protein OYC64_021815 [Pagothenia borchgrevinki]|uniref:Uncharacterized protein n=1 Tax=Pagothenia borchgrevinki TaxID=8213 RepID=A0ABD2G1E8_PAGBO